MSIDVNDTFQHVPMSEGASIFEVIKSTINQGLSGILTLHFLQAFLSPQQTDCGPCVMWFSCATVNEVCCTGLPTQECIVSGTQPLDPVEFHG
jgi:hypothetical protein